MVVCRGYNEMAVLNGDLNYDTYEYGLHKYEV